jgi:hypothetical protein
VCLFGTLQFGTSEPLICRLGVSGATVLSANETSPQHIFRSYDNVCFDRIETNITEDHEIHFSGYKFTLI